MAITYKFFKISKNFDAENVIKTDDQGKKTNIPFDPANIDYQEYLEWAKTNTADAAD